MKRYSRLSVIFGLMVTGGVLVGTWYAVHRWRLAVQEQSREYYLVTGGAGFIGSHVVDALLAMHKHVICVDNFDSAYAPAIKYNNIASHMKDPNYRLYTTNIEQYDDLVAIFKKHRIDVVIHLAARGGASTSLLVDPADYVKTNVVGTTNVLDLSAKHNVKKKFLLLP